MATFVNAGKRKINIDTVAYFEKTNKGIKVYFVSNQPPPLTLTGKDADTFNAGASSETQRAMVVKRVIGISEDDV